MARTVTAHLFSSVNGVSEDPHLFQFDAFGEEEGAMMAASLDGATDVVIGRALWEEWSEYWPANPEDGFGDFINPVRKHVVSTTLEGELDWNSRALRGDPVEAVRGMKEGDGGTIVVTGGIETVRSLFLAGVVDTLTLTIHPVVTGAGRRLFDDTVDTTRLRLVDATTTSKGNVVATYALRD